MAEVHEAYDKSIGTQFIAINVHKMKNDAVGVAVSNSIMNLFVGAPPKVKSGAKNSVFDALGDALDNLITSSNGSQDFIADLDTDIKETIWLPLPNTMREVHHQMYEDSSFNLEDAMARGALGAAEMISKKVLGNGYVSGALGNIGELTNKVARRSNIMVDTNNLMVYNGSAPRSYTMAFNLVPRNFNEAEYYSNSINKLKQFSLADLSTLTSTENLQYNVLRQQYLFSFKYYRTIQKKEEVVTEENNYLNKIFMSDATITKGFSLTSVSSTLGDNSLVVFNDGHPKVITLSLTFTERSPLWAKDIFDYFNQKKA